jgi:penicillin-binding protein 1A
MMVPAMHARTLHPSRRLAVALLAVALLAATACGTAREAPPLALPVNSRPSAIYDTEGRLITVLQQEDRSSVPLDQIPALAQNAVIAIEDARFWSHRGVDPRAIARAASSNAESGQVSQGGSTITQQYVKIALLTPERTLGRKIEEASLALSLERNYSKALILELYLNTIYFGNGAYGIDAAARNFFGVPARDLNLEQAALLAGVIRSPTNYDPRRNPGNALERRNVVLRRMYELGYITADQREAAAATPIQVQPPPARPEQLPYPAAHFVDEVKQWLLKESDVLGTTQAERYDNLYRGGLRITTTIDLDTQALAERSVASVLRNQGRDPKTPDAGLVAIEPATGYVRAMVGGYDYFGTHEYRQANLAKGAGRQTGSAFKPIVLATALDAGVPLDRRFDAPASQSHRLPGGETWTVKGGGIGTGTLEECTVVSSNTCYANVVLDPAVGPQRSIEMAAELGITDELQANPAAVLGTNDATVQDMASVYATFANEGVHVPPVYVTRIERPDGTVLHEHAHTQQKVLEPEVARAISGILAGVVDRGTGTRAAIGRPAAGKTGSSQGNVDGWFCGYTPELATAVWVGFSQPRTGPDGRRQPVRMQPPNTRITVFGGTYPAQIWSTFMRQALAGVPAAPLVDPATAPVTTTTVPPSNAALLEPPTGTDARDATVPDVAGQRGDAAVAAVQRAGLTAKRLEGAAGVGRSGLVTGQSPPAGTRLRSGSTVYVEVAPGTFVPDDDVPDLRGFGVGQARGTLEELGFTMKSESAVPPAGTLRPDGEAYEVGQIWRTSPAAGARSTDGVVTVYFVPASAPAPSSTTTAPTRTTQSPRD